MKTPIAQVQITSPTVPGEVTTSADVVNRVQGEETSRAGCHWEIYQWNAIERLLKLRDAIADERERRIFSLAAWRMGWNLSAESVEDIRAEYDELMAELHEEEGEGEEYEP